MGLSHMKRSKPAPRCRLRRNVFAGWASEELVLLDLDRDKYFGLDAKSSQILAMLIDIPQIDGEYPRDIEGDREVQTVIAHLFSRGLIEGIQESQDHNPPTIYAASELGGLEECTWNPHRSPFASIATGSPSLRMIIGAVLTLVQVDWILERRRLKGIVRCIEIEYSYRKSRFEPCEMSLIAKLHQTVQDARAWYPRKVNCVNGSAALALMMMRYGALPKFIIGVQKYPFYAHAWVEYDELVVNDLQSVRERLVPILITP